MLEIESVIDWLLGFRAGANPGVVEAGGSGGSCRGPPRELVDHPCPILKVYRENLGGVPVVSLTRRPLSASFGRQIETSWPVGTKGR